MKKVIFLLIVMIIGFNVNLSAEENQKIKRIFEGKENAKIKKSLLELTKLFKQR